MQTGFEKVAFIYLDFFPTKNNLYIRANSDFATSQFRTLAMRRNWNERYDVEYLEQRIQCKIGSSTPWLTKAKLSQKHIQTGKERNDAEFLQQRSRYTNQTSLNEPGTQTTLESGMICMCAYWNTWHKWHRKAKSFCEDTFLLQKHRVMNISVSRIFSWGKRSSFVLDIL